MKKHFFYRMGCTYGIGHMGNTDKVVLYALSPIEKKYCQVKGKSRVNISCNSIVYSTNVRCLLDDPHIF